MQGWGRRPGAPGPATSHEDIYAMTRPARPVATTVASLLTIALALAPGCGDSRMGGPEGMNVPGDRSSPPAASDSTGPSSPGAGSGSGRPAQTGADSK